MCYQVGLPGIGPPRPQYWGFSLSSLTTPRKGPSVARGADLGVLGTLDGILMALKQQRAHGEDLERGARVYLTPHYLADDEEVLSLHHLLLDLLLDG